MKDEKGEEEGMLEGMYEGVDEEILRVEMKGEGMI